MGNRSTKSSPAPSTNVLLTVDELARIERLYNSFPKEVHHGRRLKELWNSSVHEDLLTLLEHVLVHERKLSFTAFSTFYAKLAKASPEEAAEFIESLLKKGNEDLSYTTLQKYVASITSSYIRALIASNDKGIQKWRSFKIENSEERHKLFAELLIEELKDQSVQDNFGKWLAMNSQFKLIQSAFVHVLYRIPMPLVSFKHSTVEKTLIPSLLGVELLNEGTVFSTLTLPDILCLNSFLPDEKQFEWKLCYTTQLHGLGFGKLVRLIENKGPTIIIVKDSDGYMFGGYASESWIVSPNFHGTTDSFLFTLYPKMQFFPSTGYNDHYQYLNIQQQTMPNGVGMGGQFGYFGFWLDGEFLTGHCSESCSTYKGYKMLSGKKNFNVEHVEVWALAGSRTEEDETDEPASILDKDMGARALLEIAGRGFRSDGYRDKPEGPPEVESESPSDDPSVAPSEGSMQVPSESN